MSSSNDPIDVDADNLPQNQSVRSSSMFEKFKKWCEKIIYPAPVGDESTLKNTTHGKSIETLGENLRKKVYTVQDCDLHDILQESGNIKWSDWHLLLDRDDQVLNITDNFHKAFSNMTESTSIKDSVNIIDDVCLQFALKDNSYRLIKDLFQDARTSNDPKYVITAYTCHTEFSRRLNTHSAANACHFITLYCTVLNCPTLHLTKDYIDAFTRILFHPKLDKYRFKNGTVYRGIMFNDVERIDRFKVGATILTTTFLSTSTEKAVAEMFCENKSNNEPRVSVFCTYNIKSGCRRSALDIRSLSVYPEENEVLILRYIPFTIVSKEIVEDGRRINICFDEYSHEVASLNNLDSVEPNFVETNTGCSIVVHEESSRNCCMSDEISTHTQTHQGCRCDIDGDQVASGRYGRID